MKLFRPLLILFILLLSHTLLFAQSWETVKRSSEYIWGEGRGATLSDAKRNALADLLSKISLQVSGKVVQNESETVTNTGVESNSSFISTFSTYTNATLTNTESVTIKDEPDAIAGYYMKRSDVEKIFKGRKNKIADYIISAQKAEAQGKIDIALKDFYWAFMLTKTLQDPNHFRFTDEDGDSFLPLTRLPQMINGILENVKVEPVKREGDEMEILISYKGKPVNSADFTYFDGRDWSHVCSAKDGIGVMELSPGFKNSEYKAKIEFEYKDEAHIDREVHSVLNSMETHSFPRTLKVFKGEGKASAMKGTQEVTNTFSSVAPQIFSMPEPIEPKEDYRNALSSIVSGIVSKRYDASDVLFTPEGKDLYERLIRYGQARVVGSPDYRFYRQGDKIVARGLQLAFSFKTGMRKSFVEEMIFTFTPEGKIENIAFGLGKTAEADILGKGVWDEKARYALMDFLENYQTAYALKRLDYISTIFDDDAVIITGTVVKPAAKNVGSGELRGMSFGGEIIRLNRQTKDSYLRSLKRSFASKEFINIRFASNDVLKLGKGGEMYAIQIAQEYYSSNYGDKGYLFLIIDINDPERPIIKVRTWQPERDPDFGIYGPEHFK